MAFFSGTEQLPLREVLSGISSTVSLVGWVVILIPQLYENYSLGNADGLSLFFCIGWVLGAIFNVAGAIWAGLLPSVIGLGFYFCVANSVLLLQACYYRFIAKRALENGVFESEEETSPLLVGDTVADRRRRVSVVHTQGEPDVAKLLMNEDDASLVKKVVGPVAAIFGIVMVGTVGWFLAWKSGAWEPSEIVEPGQGPWGALVVGYISAVIYLFSRIPQIIQNYQTKSTEGLSLLFFMISTLANLTYGGGILFHSSDRQYVMDNLPWLLGSIGVCSEDLVLFVQFYLYRSRHRRRRVSSVSIPAPGAIAHL
ncbi:PQ-loop-domain-containing protein [Ascobolus immersus RN42]|uniref:PQ-loop-domain-containing protein n=1 Tax=Ascobolus immersus RN42 TaxID=1160509 RepID=A0A3N4I4E7_ASCIM|nr:PQ-loop-domain-containing protein [Ascobolus immersus RN42]